MSHTLPFMASQLSSRTSTPLLEADLQRLKSHYHGPYALTGTLNGPSLILGGRSGLFALALSASNRHQEVL
ncbi:MAG: hypothetical protein WCP34_15835, partial [Pseudomonadota bacterium]